MILVISGCIVSLLIVVAIVAWDCYKLKWKDKSTWEIHKEKTAFAPSWMLILNISETMYNLVDFWDAIEKEEA